MSEFFTPEEWQALPTTIRTELTARRIPAPKDLVKAERTALMGKCKANFACAFGRSRADIINSVMAEWLNELDQKSNRVKSIVSEPVVSEPVVSEPVVSEPVEEKRNIRVSCKQKFKEFSSPTALGKHFNIGPDRAREYLAAGKMDLHFDAYLHYHIDSDTDTDNDKFFWAVSVKVGEPSKGQTWISLADNLVPEKFKENGIGVKSTPDNNDILMALEVLSNVNLDSNLGVQKVHEGALKVFKELCTGTCASIKSWSEHLGISEDSIKEAMGIIDITGEEKKPGEKPKTDEEKAGKIYPAKPLILDVCYV
jgi:hypothetical protein